MLLEAIVWMLNGQLALCPKLDTQLDFGVNRLTKVLFKFTEICWCEERLSV